MPKNNRSADPVAAAREIARAEVAQRWPELAGVEPTVTERGQASSTASQRAGAALAGPAEPPAEYTFTFAGHFQTAEGYVLSRVARVTVDSKHRVVKATTSK